MKYPLLATLLCLSVLGATSSDAADTPPAAGTLATIPALDINRYMGTWFEIAKYPNWFQRKCTGETRAHYSQQSDGTVQVINRCQTKNQEMIEAMGTARQIGSASSPKLEVRFAPPWLSFLPFVWGDYWVIDLDDDYQLVAVSEPKQEYLWILSRTAKVDPVRYQSLLTRLQQQGFNLDKLERTVQD